MQRQKLRSNPKKKFGHRNGRSSCAHSIGKFFLGYIVLFSFETSATGSPGNYLYTLRIVHWLFWGPRCLLCRFKRKNLIAKSPKILRVYNIGTAHTYIYPYVVYTCIYCTYILYKEKLRRSIDPITFTGLRLTLQTVLSVSCIGHMPTKIGTLWETWSLSLRHVGFCRDLGMILFPPPVTPSSFKVKLQTLSDIGKNSEANQKQ